MSPLGNVDAPAVESLGHPTTSARYTSRLDGDLAHPPLVPGRGTPTASSPRAQRCLAGGYRFAFWFLAVAVLGGLMLDVRSLARRPGA
jgi:hypothetical protein